MRARSAVLDYAVTIAGGHVLHRILGFTRA